MTRGLHLTTRILLVIAASLMLLAFATLTACGGGGGGGGNPPPPVTLRSVSVTPATPTITLGATQQFSATGNYSDGSTRDLTASATWSSSNTAVATVSGGGLATSLAAGNTTIQATSGGVSGSTSLTVNAAALASIAVAPSASTLNHIGAPQQFKATGTYSDQSTRDLTNSVTWSSTDTGVAVVGADGFARAVGTTGTTTIRAQLSAVTGTAALTVRTATVSGQLTFPDSDMGWKPNFYDYLAHGGGKVRVLGTDIAADVVPTGATTATFTLTGVPWGNVTLHFDEGVDFDVFTQASKRAALNVNSATVSNATFALVYHWDELAGYPAAWNTMNSQGPVSWKAQFVDEQTAFIAFRRDVPSERIELYRTTDRGVNWSLVGQWIFDATQWATATWPYPVWTEFFFVDANRGFMHATTAGIPCDTGGAYFYTTDGGAHWTTGALPMTPTGYHVEATAIAHDGTHLIVTGRVGCGVQGYSSGFYDAIWESADAGATWGLAWHSARDEWGTFIGVDVNDLGRAVAYRGAQAQQFLLRDSNGVWTAHASGGIVDDNRDVAMVGDYAWLVSSGGSVPNGTYRSDDDGQNWSKVSDGLVQDFDFATERKGFAQAGGPAYVTYDGGATWRYQSAGGAIWPGVMDVWAFDRTHAAWAEVGFGDPNGVGQLFTYVEPAQASVELRANPTVADATVSRGTLRAIMAAYRIESRGPARVTVANLVVHGSGSANDAAAMTAVKLWLDRDGDAELDVDDTQLASGAFAADDGTLTLSLAGASSLEQFDAINVVVTCDLAPGTGYSGTLRVLLSAADVSAKDAVSGTPVGVSLPSGYTLAGRTLSVLP